MNTKTMLAHPAVVTVTQQPHFLKSPFRLLYCAKSETFFDAFYFKKRPPAGWGIATQVYLNYSAIEIHRADAANDSGWTTVTQAGSINLTELLDVNQTVGSTNLTPGLYNLIRFEITGAEVTVGDLNYSTQVPGDMLQVAITQGGKTVTAGQTSKLLIELNIAVHGSTEAGFTLVPDVRAMPV
jgi:hypothetical protein